MAAGFKTGGRQRGTPNKVNASLREMILGALDEVGGQRYLAAQAAANPGAFMTLVGKVLPTQIAGDPDGVPITLDIEDKRAAAKALLAETFAEKPE